MNAMSVTIPPNAGCGSGGTCQCSEASSVEPSKINLIPSINGVFLAASGERLSSDQMLERAHTELLRQEAVRQGLMPDTPHAIAPELDDAQRQVLEEMVDEVVVTPAPSIEAQTRFYAANKLHFVTGQALHVCHILFAVTPGVNVHKLAQRAETALLELSRKDVEPGRFEALARELSNCPSSSEGGDLGWIGPHDCAPELSNELFFLSDSGWGMGVHPRLVHTRFGFHIVKVLERRKGTQQPFEAVQDRIAMQMALQSRATALRQYIRLLIGQASVEGLDLEGADSPLVQ
jgi:peptidyl-prolyl cis-trans isomerase C